MRRLRTASTRRLVTIVAVLVAAVAGAGIAQAALTNSPKPDPKPLDRAIYDAVNAPPVEGITARVKFTNNLLPSGSMPGSQISPILSGADGRVWLSGDGKVRLELQSDYGDAQFVADGERYMLYDAATKTAFTGRLSASRRDEGRQARQEGVAERDPGGPGASSARRGRSPARSRRRPPAARPTRCGSPRRTTAGCSARPSWPGTPSAAPRCARRSTRRATTSRCSRSRRPRSPTARSPPTSSRRKPPAGAQVTEIDPPSGFDAQGKQTARRGRRGGPEAARLPARRAGDARRAAAPQRPARPLRRHQGRAHPLRLRASARSSCSSRRPTAARAAASAGLPLPQVNIDGATGTELATALGTILTFERDGVRYVVAGSVPPVAAENAARELQMTRRPSRRAGSSSATARSRRSTTST